MEREFIETGDGSSTLFVPGLNEHYHSVHGAIRESLHIFIKNGLEHYGQTETNILEAGFGTGLNAYLTLIHAHRNNLKVVYHSFEKYPLSTEEAEQLNYKQIIEWDTPSLFDRLHECPWEEDVAISPNFTLHKHNGDFTEVDFNGEFDIIFFDAFNPDVQPRLWSEEILSKFGKALHPGGILTTYCVKGIVKQALRNIGFSLKRLPGPPGKREILRGTKL